MDEASCESCGMKEPIEKGESAPAGWLATIVKVDDFRVEHRHANSSRTPTATMRIVRVCPDCVPDYRRKSKDGQSRGIGGPLGKR